MLAAAEAEAQRQLAAAAEQTSWTQQTVQSLLATADLEADRIRQVGHRDAVDVVRRARQGIVGVAARMRDKLDIETETSRTEAQQRRRSAEDALASAAQEAQQTRADGEREAARIREDAEATAAHTAEDARSTGSTRPSREPVRSASRWPRRCSACSARATRSCARPAPRAPPSSPQARHEADELRAQARRIVEEARAEVALLARQRDGITEELGQLSGVIQALAVPTPPPNPRHHRNPSSD